jgi:lactoylglutathione lyase
MLCALALSVALLPALTIKRPRITGVAHIALFVKDVDQSRRFYARLLGYQEPFLLNDASGNLSLTFFKINDRQYIELFPEREAGSDRLSHISIETDDAEGMRRYLESKGVKVPEKVPKGRIGNANFNIKDPDGHPVEIVQYLPGGWSVRDKGKAVSEKRISNRMMHVGIIVNTLEPAMSFYRDILGFTEIWRGSRDGKVLNWVNMKVPEGDDYVEFMLHDPVPPPAQRGVAHHICLGVSSLDGAAAALREGRLEPDIPGPWRYAPERTGSAS